jgi:hypothetical protein
MSCDYEKYIRTGGVSGRMTAARQAELLALHREHHAATCRTRCRACGAEDCASAACLRGILAAEETAMVQERLARHAAAGARNGHGSQGGRG